MNDGYYKQQLHTKDDIIAFAKQLQWQPFFRTFAENGAAHDLLELKKKSPELTIPNCDTFPQKSFNFVQDVSRLKKLCTILGNGALNNYEIRAIVMSAFNLNPVVFDEEQWATLNPKEMSTDAEEMRFYYRFYRNAYINIPDISANVLQLLLNRLAKFLKIDAISVEVLRRIEQQKRCEVAMIDNQLMEMEQAKRDEEERKERERLRQIEMEQAKRDEEERKKQEQLRKEEEERRCQEAKRQNQRLQQMKDDLVNTVFSLLNMRCGNITPCVSSPQAIKLDDTFLGYSNHIYIFGNRIQTLDIEQIGNKIVYRIRVFAWKWTAEWDGRLDNEAMNTFIGEFRKAKDILPSVAGMDNRLEIVITASKRHWGYVVFLLFLVGFVLFVIVGTLPSMIVWLIALATFIYCHSFLQTPDKMLQSILRNSSTVDSLLANIQSNKLFVCESITRE